MDGGARGGPEGTSYAGVYLPAGAGKQAAQGHRSRHTLDKIVYGIAWRL